jgi:hypothetical protein
MGEASSLSVVVGKAGMTSCPSRHQGEGSFPSFLTGTAAASSPGRLSGKPDEEGGRPVL